MTAKIASKTRVVVDRIIIIILLPFYVIFATRSNNKLTDCYFFIKFNTKIFSFSLILRKKCIFAQ